MSEDKWAKIEATAKARGKVGDAGKGGEGGAKSEKAGARGKQKAEGQRLSVSDIRKARETLSEMSPSQMVGMLGISKSALTPKQRAFAYNVAMGVSKAEAYRTAYKRDAKYSSVRTDPYKIAADPRIAREIEAYKLAQEAAKHRTPEQLRNLVIQTLVQQVIDPETPPAIRTQAVKTLGQVTEVAAFTERKESVVHHSSDKLRADIFAQVTALMAGTTVEGERIEHDAASLLAELTASTTTLDSTLDSSDTDGPSLAAQDTTQPDNNNA